MALIVPQLPSCLLEVVPAINPKRIAIPPVLSVAHVPVVSPGITTDLNNIRISLTSGNHVFSNITPIYCAIKHDHAIRTSRRLNAKLKSHGFSRSRTDCQISNTQSFKPRFGISNISLPQPQHLLS